LNISQYFFILPNFSIKASTNKKHIYYTLKKARRTNERGKSLKKEKEFSFILLKRFVKNQRRKNPLNLQKRQNIFKGFILWKDYK
jgi:flagella basal body P-ring formation protein FlgA